MSRRKATDDSVVPITVLMPVYNADRYLGRAIESVLKQRAAAFEFVIVDDGSTDRSVELASSYDDPRIRLIRSPVNRGIVPALQEGMRSAKGEYVARLDADDVCLPDRLARQADYLCRHPGIIVLGAGCETINADGALLGRYCGPTAPIANEWRLLFGNPIVHSTTMIRRIEFAKLGGYQPGFPHAEDYEAWTRVVQNVPESIAQLPIPVVQSRHHVGQITSIHGATMAATRDGIARRNIEHVLGHPVDAIAASLLSTTSAHLKPPDGSQTLAYELLAECWRAYVPRLRGDQCEKKQLTQGLLLTLATLARHSERKRHKSLWWALRHLLRDDPGTLLTPDFFLLASRAMVPLAVRRTVRNLMR